MKLLDSLRKGFRFFLMSFGVSSTSRKPNNTQKPVPKSGPNQ